MSTTVTDRLILPACAPLPDPRRASILSRLLAPGTDAAYALLRVLTGLMFAFHGFQKLFGVLLPFPIEVGSQVWIGGVIELLGGVMIAAGFGTRLAAFVCS